MAEIVVGRATPGSTIRTGFGVDEHAFGPGLGLWLGGVEIPEAPRLHGHSDGDAALHALAGALLGAAALGDLGDLFPADERTPRGAPSSEFVRDAMRRLEAGGWRPAALDLTIRAARPRLASFAPAMRSAIASLLDIDTAAISIKLSTGNLSGDAGAGRTIEARAIVTIRAAADAS
jgi:2-C-methyl-D-erythritol 2,4-cyclodiphosphate synthase